MKYRVDINAAMGIGLTIISYLENSSKIIDHLYNSGENAYILG